MIETFRMALAFALLFAVGYWGTSLMLFIGGGLVANVVYWTLFTLWKMFGPGPE